MSDKLLTTREASTFLRVSEASVRRWADAGILTGSRVGRRGARRFREADLLQFMQPGNRRPTPSAAEARAVVIQGMAGALGRPLVGFCSIVVGRLWVSVPVLRVGVLSGAGSLVLLTGPPRLPFLVRLGVR